MLEDAKKEQEEMMKEYEEPQRLQEQTEAEKVSVAMLSAFFQVLSPLIHHNDHNR